MGVVIAWLLPLILLILQVAVILVVLWPLFVLWGLEGIVLAILVHALLTRLLYL